MKRGRGENYIGNNLRKKRTFAYLNCSLGKEAKIERKQQEGKRLLSPKRTRKGYGLGKYFK